MSHTRRLQSVKVYDLRTSQHNLLRNEKGGRSLGVLLALPPLSREYHGVGARQCATSATSKTVSSLSSAVWSAATTK